MTAPVWEDARVARGLARLRRLQLAEPGARLGWKTGMGGPVAEQLGTTGALVGYITRGTLLADGATVDVSGWVKPVLEPEIAIRLGADLAPGATREQAYAAIDALASAIELADVDLPFEDPEAIFAHKLFHRAVILGPFDTGRGAADAPSIELSVRAGDRLLADHVDPLIPVGDLGDVAAYVAAVVAQLGDVLAAGDVVITGSGVAAIGLAPGDGRIEVCHHGLGTTSVTIA